MYLQKFLPLILSIPYTLQTHPKHVTVAAIINPPYVLSSSDSNLTEGLEVQLLNTIFKRINVTVTYIPIENPEEVGTINPNGTLTGLYKMLDNKQVDLIIGGMNPSHNSYKNFDNSVIYFTKSLTWCVPAAEEKDPLENFLDNSWMLMIFAVVGSFIGGALVYWEAVLSSRRPSSLPWTFFWKIVLGFWAASLGIATHIPTGRYKRAIFIVWVFGVFFVSYEVTTMFVGSVTQPGSEKQMKTLKELQENRVKYFVNYWTKDSFEKSGLAIYEEIARNSEVCLYFEDCLEKAIKVENGAVGTFRRVGNFPLTTKYIIIYKQKDFFCFQDKMPFFNLCLLMRKPFALKGKILRGVNEAQAAGLVEAWEKKYFYNRVSKRMYSNEFAPFKLRQLAGAFKMYLLGNLIALLVFFLELITKKLQKPQK